MDFSNTLFRCSSLGHIMTEPRSKSEDLSESCKTHLIDIYVSKRYNRQTDIQNKYVQKGLMVEEDSITLFSRVKSKFFKKNIDRLENTFIRGCPDLFQGAKIYSADEVIELKSSWDIFTFFRTQTKKVDSMYYWQCQGYMDLTNAPKSTLGYCLVNTPETIISDEKRRLLWKMGVATEENSDYIQACEEMDRLMRYDDIPMGERVIEFEVLRNQADIDRMHEKVTICREYLNELHQKITVGSMVLQ